MTHRPQSATSFSLSFFALLVALCITWVMAPWHNFNLAGIFPYTAIAPCLGLVLVIAIAEFLLPSLRAQSVHPISRRAVRKADLRRVCIRLGGLCMTVGLVALVYWLLPEYHGEFYQPYWLFLRTVTPLVVLVPFYFLWIDTHGSELRDEYLAFGSLVWAGSQTGDGRLIRRHLLSWTIKAFFLPLMTVYLSGALQTLYAAWHGQSWHLMPVYQIFYHLSYAIDLLFCVVGYSTTLRLFGSEIRSVEPTVAGWLVALICYQPFYSVIGRNYLQYDDATFWDNWLQGLPLLQMAWAAAIISLVLIYALCTTAFGLRFSNLTHRGIITDGPYRFSKHPAYLAKNLSWWLISVPFVSELGWQVALRNCCLLAMVNLVYYARARTEERHLSMDPTYVAYAVWINENGLLRRAARILPFLRYKPPALDISAGGQPSLENS